MTELALSKLDEMRGLLVRAIAECDRALAFWRNIGDRVSCSNCREYAEKQLASCHALRVELQQIHDGIVALRKELLQ